MNWFGIPDTKKYFFCARQWYSPGKTSEEKQVRHIVNQVEQIYWKLGYTNGILYEYQRLGTVRGHDLVIDRIIIYRIVSFTL